MKNVKELHKGDHIVHREEPHRVLKKEIIAVGTHSHTKVKILAQGIFNGVTETLNFAPHSNVEDVDIIRKKGQIIANQPQNLQVMDLVSYETLQAAANDELLEQLNEGDEITFVEFEGNAQVLEKR
tara:strand:- start:36065 stop:36442 length:378 start_codon:yes stop_codon:yes gene_type:complete